MTGEIIAKYDMAKQEYLDRLTWNGVSKTTQKNYETSLRLFGDFLRETDADDIYEAVEAWKESMLHKGNLGSTVNSRLTDLGIFFGKASKKSFPKKLRFTDNHVEDVEPVKVAKRPYDETLTDDQVKMLYRNEPYRGARLWARTYAAVMILVNEKLRNSEVTSLTLADVDFRYHELTVRHGKGDKFRVVDMCRLTETAIHAYLESGIRPANLSDDDFLFGSMRGGKWSNFSSQGLSSLVEHHVKEVCGVSGVRTHALRHIGSRVCLNAGTSLEELQGALGHSSKVTTEIYAGRIMQRRRRESAQSVLAARDEEARRNQTILDAQQLCIAIRKQA